MDALGCPQTEIQPRETHVAMVAMSVVYKAKIGNVEKQSNITCLSVFSKCNNSIVTFAIEF